MKKIIIVLSAVFAISVLVPGDIVYAKGGRVGGFRSSSVRVSSSPKPSAPAVAKTAVKATPAVSTKPSVETKKVVSTKTVTSSTGKKMSGNGSVVDQNYQPRFNGGYVPPAGSVVYYRSYGVMDWLPFYLIMTQGSQREAVVQTPDGKEQTIKEEGVDTMYVINWIVSILFIVALIFGVMYLVTNYSKNKNYAF